MVLRVIPPDIPAFETLGLPKVILSMAEEPRGLVLVTGVTGSGKTCTIAALIRAVLEAPEGNGMPHAHFIIFDTNAEYEEAFTQHHANGPGSC